MTAQFSYPSDREESSAAQIRALEALLIERGVITSGTVDKVLGYFESEMTPLNGTKIVARAWADSDFARRLVADAPAAIAELDLPEGMAGAEGEHLAAVVNEPGIHNLVICSLCSCFPWPVLGLPPYWYKNPVFRARAARSRVPSYMSWVYRLALTLRSGSGTPAGTPAGSWYPSGPRAPRGCPKNNSHSWSRPSR